MKKLEKCDICGKEIDLMVAKLEDEGFIARNKHLISYLAEVYPYFLSLKGEYLPEAFICSECAYIYIELLNLKIEWYLLTLLFRRICILFKPSIRKYRARCNYCNEWFTQNHGNQKYCLECKDKHRKEYKKHHARESYRIKNVYNREFPVCKHCNKPITPDNNKLTVAFEGKLNSLGIDVNYSFIHGNLKYHPNCFLLHRSGYLNDWALKWFKKNYIWLDPRRGIYKYNFYKINCKRVPFKEYRYIMSTVCYKCREIGVFHIIRRNMKLKKGKMYVYRLKECKNCGHKSESIKEHRPKEHWRNNI